MNWIFLASLAVTALAFAASLAVLRQTRDLRVALLSGVFGALGVGQGLMTLQGWGDPLSWDSSLAVACAGLAASTFGWLAVRAVGRTLSELDRTEALHWNSMEGVRALAELSAERGLSPEDRVARLLEIGSRCFGLGVGMLSRVNGQRYEITAIRAPAGLPIGVGAAFPLADTCCRLACESQRPVAISRRDDPSGTAVHGALPFEAYLGVALREAGQVTGTLAFGSLEARAARFTASDKDLLQLMARWLEMEREERGARAVVAIAAPVADPELREIAPRRDRAPAPEAPWAGMRPARQREIDLNALVQRMEQTLRDSLDPGVGLHLDLAAVLAPVRDLRLPLDAIVRSLVHHAAAGLAGGGEIFIETRNLESERSATEVVPAHAPDRYVTLSVHDTGVGADADSLSALFDETRPEDAAPPAASHASLGVAALYRMLQRCGGDLSVEVEPGHGRSFTIFLPRGREAISQRQAPAVVATAGRA